MPQLPEMVKVLLLGRVNFEGSNAFGFSAISRVSKNVYLTGGFGTGLGKGTVGGRAGVTVARQSYTCCLTSRGPILYSNRIQVAKEMLR